MNVAVSNNANVTNTVNANVGNNNNSSNYNTITGGVTTGDAGLTVSLNNAVNHLVVSATQD